MAIVNVLAKEERLAGTRDPYADAHARHPDDRVHQRAGKSHHFIARHKKVRPRHRGMR